MNERQEKPGLQRRDVLKLGVGLGLLGFAGSVAAQSFEFKPSQRYPDPAVQILDPSFGKYRVYSATVEQLATGFRWAEGPVWFGDGRYVLFSDIPNNRIMRYDEATGQTGVFRYPANFANGMCRDRQGRLLVCEHSVTRRITRTEYDGSTTMLADRFEGKRFNAPNDIVCKSDGSIWFTDPPFGILGNYEGEKATAEMPHGVYRIDGQTGKITRVLEATMPNGLCFSPDEKKLYIISRIPPARLVFAYDVTDDGQLRNQTKLIDAGTTGALDGMRCDTDGNIWAGWGSSGSPEAKAEELDGVMVFNPQGKAIGHIRLPERCANLCFGGAKRNRLFMASSHSLYALYVEAHGAV
jgi:gluconolactonase